MEKLLFLVNPIAGAGKAGNLREIVDAFAIEQQLNYEIHHTLQSGDYASMQDLVKDGGFTRIVTAGGDGTINKVALGLGHLGLPIAVLPCGSGNGLALTAGIPKEINAALHNAITGKAVEIDGMFMNGDFACMLCGLGLDAQVAHDFAAAGTRGLTTYVKKTLSNFLTAKAYRFQLSVEDKIIDTEAYFISIANSNQFGNNFTIAPQASLTDGLLDIVIMTRQNKVNMLYQTFRQVMGMNKVTETACLSNDSSVLYFQTSSLSILNPDNAPLHIDGDPAESCEDFSVSVSPRFFSLVVPAR